MQGNSGIVYKRDKIRGTKMNNRFNSKPMFVFELANNHSGDVEHGLTIIKKFITSFKNLETILILVLNYNIGI